MGSTDIFGSSTSGVSTAGSSRTGEDMYADGSAGSSLVGFTGVDDAARPPAHPAAAAAALPGADAAGAANFFSTGLLCTGVTGGFAWAGRLGAEGLANFVWAAALTVVGTAMPLAGAAAAFAACGFDSLHFSNSSSSSLPFWKRSAGSFARAFMMRSLNTG